VGFILTAIGLLLLVIFLGGGTLGLYMAADRRTRERGLLFAALWVPGLAAASGVLMRDVATFTVGLLCFLIAGAVFALQSASPYGGPVSRKGDLAREPAGKRLPDDPEKTTKENESQGPGTVAS